MAALLACGDDAGDGAGGAGTTTTSTNTTTTAAGDCTPPAPGIADGRYLLTLSIQLFRTRPLFFETQLRVTDDGLAMTIVPLSTPYRRGDDNASTPAMTPVGPPIELGPFAIDAGGGFTAALPLLSITGRANPFSTNDLEAEIALIGELCEETDKPGSRRGFVCGEVRGQVVRPLSLDLSSADNSFTLTTYAGEAGVRPAYACDGELVEGY